MEKGALFEYPLEIACSTSFFLIIYVDLNKASQVRSGLLYKFDE